VLSDKEKNELVKERAKAKRAAQPFVKRPIQHPYFKNVNPLQATELLHGSDLGAYIIRPSVKYGTSAIAITIKVRTCYALCPSMRIGAALHADHSVTGNL
jgi:hypothetical protein